MLWLITDTHLGHDNMVKLCGRPKNFSEMILENWSKMVKPNDTVLHLGDIAWHDSWLKRLMALQGNKILVRGNHDKKPTMEYMHHGFTMVCDMLSVTFDGMEVIFSHRPLQDFKEDINIHGHLHNLYRGCGKRWLPLALETMGYRPIAINKEFLRELHKWVDNNYIPSLQDIIALRQGYYGVPRATDIYGSVSYKGEHFLNKKEPIEFIVLFRFGNAENVYSAIILAQSPNEAQNKLLTMNVEEIEHIAGCQAHGKLRVVNIYSGETKRKIHSNIDALA